MNVKKILLSLILSSCIYAALCQSAPIQLYKEGYYINSYTPLSGLGSNSSTCLFQDSKGFLWIGSFKGLSRFDGLKFINYGLKEGLPGLSIFQVCEDSSGYIYVSTATGIARYTGRRNGISDTCFYTYPQTVGLDAPIMGMQAIDSNTILFQKTEKGLFLLHNKKLSCLWEKTPGYMISVFKDHNNYCYVYKKDTFRVYNSECRQVNTIFFPDSEFTTACMDRAGNLQVCYNGKKYRLDPLKGLTDSMDVPRNFWWFCSMDTGSKLFYANADGLYLHNNGKETKIIDLVKLKANSNGFRQGRDGSVWMSAGGLGILKAVPLPYYEIKQHSPGAFIRNENGKKIIETDSRLPERPDVSRASGKLRDIIRSVLVSKHGTLWYCTDDGIYEQAPGRPLLHHSFPGNDLRFGNSSKSVFGAVETDAGDIWFYGYCGIVFYSNGHFKQFTERNGLHPESVISQVVIEKDGTVLACDLNNLFMVRGDTLVPMNRNLGLVNFFPGNNGSVNTDNYGAVWISYDKSLFKIEKKQPGKYSITDSIVPSSSLLHSPDISAFAFDGRNNCWVGYPGGKMEVYFSDANGKFSSTNSITYTRDDGLAPTADFDYTLIQDRNKDIVLVPQTRNTDRLFVFTIAHAGQRKRMQAPQVSLTGISINNKIPDWTAIGYAVDPEGIPVSPGLKHHNNNITFEYAGVLLSNPSAISYRVMLKGYDKEWRNTNETTVGYTNLPAGKYLFMVKAANANGDWSETCEYDFTLWPPWYETWWAILLWILICISLIVFLFFLRFNSVRMNSLKESNLFKSNLIGLIGHDMMTPMRYIAKVSSQLRTYHGKLSEKTVMCSIDEINSTATQLHFFGESVIHWIKIQNQGYNPVISEFDLTSLVNELIGFHFPMSSEKQNQIINELPRSLLCQQDPVLIKVIMHNLLLNSNKFTKAGTIHIRADTEGRWLSFSIQDTGKGMEKEKIDSLNRLQPIMPGMGTNNECGWGMGYVLMIDLLKFSGGTLHVESKINDGTTVTVRLPISKRILDQKSHFEN